jgi:hypothetical protein
MSTKLVVVGKYPRPEAAHVARLQLEQEGLLVFVQDEDEWLRDAFWPVGGVKVLVPEDQVEAAKRILGVSDD